jgi:phenylacetate-coenzyme A ligase PaaK-like adenylate-forming protein
MPIIGKLIKKSSELSYKRNFKKGRKYTSQLRSLFKLIEKAKETNFGKKYDFKELMVNQKLVKTYQKNVPITNYEEFYENWLKKSIAGEKNHTWPGKISYYALSSGTTGAPSKRIPVTKQMIRSFQKTSVNQSSTLYKLNLSENVYDAKILVVGGSSQLKKIGQHYEGDLSGILKKNTAFIFNPFTKPNSNITKITDWNKKMEKMIEKAPSWNIGIIAGVPSWCLMLMEKIIERYNLKTIHDIWPNFEVYMHGGVYMQPYISRLNKIVGKKINLLDTYLASEGYFAYQTSPDKNGMQLLLENGIFYEFIPFTSEFFNEAGELKDKHVAFNLSQVTKGVDYALVITTNAGLWRYMIGDLVQFVDVEKYEIKITGRIKQFLSLVGEHLSLDNINQAISNVSKKFDVEILEFCLFANTEKQNHSWYISLDKKIDKKLMIKEIDKELGELNDDYKTCRLHNLNSPTIEFIDVSKFYNYLEKICKSGSQNKFPRVLNNEQAKNWISYLEEN